jgi:hypothetical protein
MDSGTTTREPASTSNRIRSGSLAVLIRTATLGTIRSVTSIRRALQVLFFSFFIGIRQRVLRAPMTTRNPDVNRSRTMPSRSARTLFLLAITELAFNGALTGTSRIKDVDREVPHFRRNRLCFRQPQIQRLEIRLQQWVSAQFSYGYCSVLLLHCDLRALLCCYSENSID